MKHFPDLAMKVSGNDATYGALNGKLVAGTGITLTENNDGANETITVASTVTGGSVLSFITAATVLSGGNLGTFTDVDVTAQVGGDAGNLDAVLLYVKLATTGAVTPDATVQLRKNGTSNAFDVVQLKTVTSGAGQSVIGFAMVEVDSGDIFEYKINTGGSASDYSVDIVMLGYGK